MRLHTHHGAPLVGRVATRDFAWHLDAFGEVQMLPTAPEGRICPCCGARLSRYNIDASDICRPCQRRGDRPLTPEELARVFEAVVGVLAEPLDFGLGEAAVDAV